MADSKESGLQCNRCYNQEIEAMRVAHEKSIQRNPHPDFKSVESSRPQWRSKSPGFSYTQTVSPTWTFGEGGTDGGASLAKAQIEINPYAPGRPAIYNYKLMISGVAPRPIAFLSTIGKHGKSTNLAPFSFMNMISYDPPLFTVGFTGTSLDTAKDTLKNLIDTEECVLNMISEHFVEAANSASVNVPYGVSEWDISGLHQEKSSCVKPARVKEAVFAVECRLVDVREFESRETPGKKTSVLAILEGVNFWVREDAVNEDKNIIDPAILRPVSRLGGITYGRTTEGFELLRPDFEDVIQGKVASGLGTS